MTLLKKLKKNSGFVLLFAITLSSIVLAVALGVANIALKELNFSTSAKDTNDAFFAADTGVECAAENDKTALSTGSAFGGSRTFACSNAHDLTGNFASGWDFIVSGIGSANLSCARVHVQKTTNDIYIQTQIVSKGYNIGTDSCDSTNSNRVERQLEVNY